MVVTCDQKQNRDGAPALPDQHRSVVVALTAFCRSRYNRQSALSVFVTVQWSPESRSGAVPYNRLPPADNQSPRHAASVAQYASADRHGRSREYRADFAGTLPARRPCAADEFHPPPVYAPVPAPRLTLAVYSRCQRRRVHRYSLTAG